MKNKPMKNGEQLDGFLGQYCDLCRYSFGGSMTPCPAVFLNGKLYHPGDCYKTAFQTYVLEKQTGVKK